MKLADLSVSKFIEELASDSPAPGGGSVAALCGALGAALAGMVAGLTLGREKYASAEEAMKSCASRAEKLTDRFMELMETDTESFNAFMAARKLPKGTEEEKKIRLDAIEKASKFTTSVPLETLEACVELADIACAAAESGNPNAISDAGVSGLLAFAASRAAAYNVRINLPGIKDRAFADDCIERVERACKEVAEKSKKIESAVESSI